MKIAIVGSRSRTDKQAVIDYVNALPVDSVVVSGGCRGVDRWAEAAALARGLEVKIFLPDLTNCRQPWQFTKAFYARNRRVVEFADKVVAFVGADRKGGTENTLSQAVELGKPVVVIRETDLTGLEFLSTRLGVPYEPGT